MEEIMKASRDKIGRETWTAAAAAPALVLTFALLGSAGGAAAGEIKEPPRFTKSSDYSSLKDWQLKGENIVPFGHNPLYFPLQPGHKHIHERPDHPDGKYRKETVVLPETEPFDIPGLGKFKTAIVQEEEYMDGVLTQRALNWFAMDKSTNSVYSFGEVSWEIDDEKKPHFAGTWRAGEPDGNGVAEPGLLMPGTFTVGGRYIFDGSESEAYGGSENMEAGITFTVPAGTFKDCVRVREQGLHNTSDITDKIYCPKAGLVYDTSDGKLVASNQLPAGTKGADVSSIGTFLKNALPYKPPVAKVSSEQATAIALKEIPGKATSVKIERKRGKNVYTVEIMTASAGEKDVFVDIESGAVVGID
jgi:Peptidase propeptide and YPEB domain